jgi:hypothetical protein
MSAKSKQREAFAQMQASVSKYARANGRRMVLRSMREVKYLKCVPLDPTASSTSDSLQTHEEELVNEDRIILNGVPFHGSQHFLTTLRELCGRLCEQEGVWMHGRKSLQCVPQPHFAPKTEGGLLLTEAQRLMKSFKTHRSAFDFDRGFVNSTLKVAKPKEGDA